MSFDIFLWCYRNGESATFKRQLVEEIFAKYMTEPDFPLESPDFRDGGHAQVFGADDEDDIKDMMFNHVAGDMAWDAIHELLDRTGSIITWPSDESEYVVASEDIVAHLPADLRDDDEAVFHVARSGKDLSDLVGGSDLIDSDLIDDE